MAKDKYKIRLSSFTYFLLQDDMYTFNFERDNGEPNKNRFYNTLILGFYNDLVYKRCLFNEYLADKAYDSFKICNDLTSFSTDLFSKVTSLYNSDIKTRYHTHEIFIYPTKETRSMFDEIELNETKNISMSEFIRNLFNEYIKNPGFERERCLHWDNFEKIDGIIRKNLIAHITTTSGTKFELKPYMFAHDIEEIFNYLVGINLSSPKQPIVSIRLCKIKDIVIKNEYFEFTQEEIKRLNHQIQEGPALVCDDTTHAVIKFDKQGIKKYDICYKDRPLPTTYDDETGIYTFDTDLNKLYLYLLQFGKHAKVIEPISLKEKLNKFHKEAIDE